MNSTRITASYLKEYAHVNIQWTNCLSDHLLLLRERDWKRVLVFRHAGFAHVALRWLKHLKEKSNEDAQDHEDAIGNEHAQGNGDAQGHKDARRHEDAQGINDGQGNKISDGIA
jgi:hypothetical protein